MRSRKTRRKGPSFKKEQEAESRYREQGTRKLHPSPQGLEGPRNGLWVRLTRPRAQGPAMLSSWKVTSH